MTRTERYARRLVWFALPFLVAFVVRAVSLAQDGRGLGDLAVPERYDLPAPR